MKEKWYAVAGNWEKVSDGKINSSLHMVIYDNVMNEDEALGRFVGEIINKLGKGSGWRLVTWQVTTFLVPKDSTAPAPAPGEEV